MVVTLSAEVLYGSNVITLSAEVCIVSVLGGEEGCMKTRRSILSMLLKKSLAINLFIYYTILSGLLYKL